MTDASFRAACAALGEARRSARVIEPLRPDWIPASVDEASRLQQAVAAAAGTVRGWKISGITAAQQLAMGIDAPLCAPLLAPWVRDSGSSLALDAFIRPRLECEFAFELGQPLPTRDEAYSRAEVEAAIGELRLVVEVVDSRLPAGSPLLMELADDLNNGAFVVGPVSRRWATLRYAEQTIVLRRDDPAGPIEIARGSGREILDGDPVGAVLLLANLHATWGQGLRAGDIVTTGSCTGAVAVPGPGTYEADFGDLGSVRLVFT